jgi:hypothetical protein
MILRMRAVTRNAALDNVRQNLDIGSGPATIAIYSGTQPADGDAALSGNTLLATLTMSDPAAPAASAGVLTFSTITEDTGADATGTATWARVRSSDGAQGFDCDVTATGGGGVIELNTVSIVAGGPVRITAFTFSIPASIT